VEWFETIFGSQGELSPTQAAARAALIFFYGLALVRLAGRRTFGKWSALDIVVSIIVGSNLSRAMTGNAPLLGTLLATTMLMILHGLVAHAAARHRGLSRIVEGRSEELAEHGVEDRAAMQRNAVTQVDLNEALRGSGVERVDQTRKITLEPSGKINILKP
jgi:uncharacterized membrane protein YcaP (DUF421 family)